MPARVSLAALFALAVLGACSNDTAIVLSIRAGDSGAQGATRLELYVGAGAVAPARSDAAFPAVWWRRAVVEPTAVDLDGALADRTYDMLLSPTGGLALDSEVVYAVVALAPVPDGGGVVVGFAHPDDFIRFAEGEVRRIDVPLVDFDPEAKIAGITDSGCVWWTAPERSGPPDGPIRDRAIVPIGDQDCDGFRGDVAAGCGLLGDCRDTDPDVHPGQRQGCSDDDTDCCPTTTADHTDADHDDVEVCAGDCVDEGGELDIFGRLVPAIAIHPGVIDDTCNGVDEACARDQGGGCDGAVPDPDGDGYVTCGAAGSVRQTNCHTFVVPDCLEEGSAGGVPAAEIHPEADDKDCDGVDQDCDRHCDNGRPLDEDGDGFSRCANTGLTAEASLGPVCPPAIADCDDSDPWGQPGGAEVCDGIDTACDDAFAMTRRLCLPTGTTAGQCVLGTMVCAEEPGQPAFTPCMPNPGATPLPDLICAPCLSGNDPLNCDDGRFRTCGIHTVMPSGSVACPTPPQQIGLQQCPNCTWSLEAGTDVNGWRVSLVDASAAISTGASPTFTGTNAALRALLVGPQSQTFVIKRTTPMNVITWEVFVLRRDQDACSVVQCSGGPG